MYEKLMQEAREEFAAYERNRYIVIWFGNTRVVKYCPVRYCTICGKKAWAKYLCHVHYSLWWFSNTEKGKICRKKNDKLRYERLRATEEGRKRLRGKWQRYKIRRAKRNGSKRDI